MKLEKLTSLEKNIVNDMICSLMELAILLDFLFSKFVSVNQNHSSRVLHIFREEAKSLQFEIFCGKQTSTMAYK